MSLIALVVFSPFGLIIAIILKLTGEHYIFYVHPRIGKNGKHFGLIKFATMLKDSPNLGTGDVTVKNDPRVLPLGHFLRKTKINELPQIINVLKGDMSIVGPRPLTPKNFDYYSDEVAEIICRIRPGLSGIGSIIFRDEETMMADSDMSCHEFYRQHIAPYKGELETWYQHNRSLRVDMMLVFLTAWVIVFPKTNLIFREVNVEGTRRLAECAAAAGVRRFVFVSSIKVNGESTKGKPFSEEDIPKPGDSYAISKWEAEQLLREIEASTDMSVTILRPPLLYGPGVKANFLKLIKLVDKGIPLPLGSIDNKRSLLGLGNIADLIGCCIEQPAA